MPKKRILILGIGNTLVSDDGIGIYIVRSLREASSVEQSLPGVHFQESSLGGLRLLDFFEDFPIVVIIDSIITGQMAPGSVTSYQMDCADGEFIQRTPTRSGHTLSLHDTIALGKYLDYTVPEEIYIVAVEIIDNTTIKESLSQKLHAMYPDIVKNVKSKIEDIVKEHQ